MAQICQVWLNGGSMLQFISRAKRSEMERFLRLSSSFLIATQTMAALRANRSLMINQSKYALTPFTHSNKPKAGPRRTKWKMTEEGKTRATRCKAGLIECEPRVVRHPATRQKKKEKKKKAWSESQGDIVRKRKENPQHHFTVNTHTAYFLSAYYTALPCNNQYRPTFYGTRS